MKRVKTFDLTAAKNEEGRDAGLGLGDWLVREHTGKTQ